MGTQEKYGVSTNHTQTHTRARPADRIGARKRKSQRAEPMKPIRRNVLMTEDTVWSKVFISPQQIILAALIKLNQ